MNFDFNEEQIQLRDTVRKWVSNEYSFEKRHAIIEEGGFSRDAYNGLVELGLSGLTIPESLGGFDMSVVESMIVMEELGRGMVLEPFTHTLMASTIMTQYADEKLQSQWCEKLVTGE